MHISVVFEPNPWDGYNNFYLSLLIYIYIFIYIYIHIIPIHTYLHTYMYSCVYMHIFTGFEPNPWDGDNDFVKLNPIVAVSEEQVCTFMWCSYTCIHVYIHQDESG